MRAKLLNTAIVLLYVGAVVFTAWLAQSEARQIHERAYTTGWNLGRAFERASINRRLDLVEANLGRCNAVLDTRLR